MASSSPYTFVHTPTLNREFLSGQNFQNEKWRAKKFEFTNGKNAEFTDCDFSASIFENAYFRDAKFTNCQFTGCKFIDCNLNGARFYLCDLRFTQFHRTLLDVKELLAAIPSDPNMRKDSLQSLMANAAEVGDYANQRLIVLQGIEATKAHLKNIIWPPDSYYRQKYPDLLPKLGASWQLFWLKLSGFVWGNGERPRNIIISGSLFLLLLTLSNFWSVYTRVTWQESSASLRILAYTIALFLDLHPDQKFRGYLLVDYAIVIVRYLYIGLYISVLYRKISHR